MRSNGNYDLWASLTLSVGLAAICFSKLSEPVLASSASSDRLLRVASMRSGNFSNEEQVREETINGQPTLDIIYDIFYPVYVSLFEPAVTWYNEQVVNGEVLRRQILVPEEDDKGLVHFKVYKVIRPLPSKPWSSNSDRLHLTWDDLEDLQGCDFTYFEIDDGIFFGEIPNCLSYSAESHRFYPMVLTCNVWGVLVPVGNTEPEKSSHVPYQLRRITRYPLLPSSYADVDNYENLCL